MGRVIKTSFKDAQGKTRFPDILTKHRLIEIKTGMKKVGLTPQMRAYLDFCKKTGRKFELWLPSGGDVTGPLERAIIDAKGVIKKGMFKKYE